MPLLMPFAAAGLVTSIINIAFKEIRCSSNSNISEDTQSLLRSEVEEGNIQNQISNLVESDNIANVPQSALTFHDNRQNVGEIAHQPGLETTVNP